MKTPIRHIATTLTALGLAALLAAPALAQQGRGQPSYNLQAQTATAEKSAMVESRASQAVTSLFQRLCPGRCELIGVEAETSDPTPNAAVAPGFESISPGAYEAEVESVTISTVIDSKLPGNFKQNLPRMIEYQLGDLAANIDVRQEMLDFPEPQNRPMPPELPQQQPQRMRPPQPPPMPRLMPQPDQEEPEEEPAPAAEPAEAETDLGPLFAAALPWIGLMLVLLLLFALGLVFMRRLAELFFDRTGAAGASESDEARKKSTPPVDVDGLRSELNRSRSVRNRVLRRWLEEDPQRVAQLVHLIGPEVLKDIKSDPQFEDKLAIVSEELTATTEPLEDDEAHKLAREVRARLNAARVVHTDDDLHTEWAFLEGLDAPTLRRVLRGLSSSEKLYVVGKLPAPLRAAYLERLDASERRAFFESGSLDTLDKRQALELAARLRQAVEDVSHVGGEVQVRATLMRDMLRALHLQEQMESVQQMRGYRPEVTEAMLSMVCLEATLPVLDADVLAEAVHRLPIETLTHFLTRTHPEVRQHVMNALPSDKRGAIETELSLELRISNREFFEARQAVADRVKEAMRRGGYDLAAANKRALGLHTDQTTTATQEMPS